MRLATLRRSKRVCSYDLFTTGACALRSRHVQNSKTGRDGVDARGWKRAGVFIAKCEMQSTQFAIVGDLKLG